MTELPKKDAPSVPPTPGKRLAHDSQEQRDNTPHINTPKSDESQKKDSKDNEPRTKLEADQATGPDPHPGNVSVFSDQHRSPLRRAEKLGSGKHSLITDPVQDAKDSEKIGPGPGVTPTAKPTTRYRYQHVILPAGPEGDIVPGPETAAIQACINSGYRPVGEPTLEPVIDHPDGVSKVVTWSIPCVEAADPAWREAE